MMIEAGIAALAFLAGCAVGMLFRRVQLARARANWQQEIDRLQETLGLERVRVDRLERMLNGEIPPDEAPRFDVEPDRSLPDRPVARPRRAAPDSTASRA